MTIKELAQKAMNEAQHIMNTGELSESGVTNMARLVGKTYGSRGGKKYADSLTEEQRKAKGKAMADARWNK